MIFICFLLAALFSLVYRFYNRKQKTVIVIGAGMAGLTAAKNLSRHFKVIVLEGRNRIGGRIHTDTKSFGFPIDLGASWIHGMQENPLAPFIFRSEIKVHATDREAIYQIDGFRPDEEREQRIYQQKYALYDLLRKLSSLAKTDPIVWNGIEYSTRNVLSVKDFMNLNGEKLLKALDVCKEDEVLLKNLFMHMEGNDGAKFEEISFQGFHLTKELEGAHVIFPTGYIKLLHEAIGSLPTIQLNTVVQSIKWDGRECIIQSNKGSLQADHVVIAVPLGVLKSQKILFSPSLPSWKADCISKVPVGLYNKIFLLFDHAFWPGDLDAIRISALKKDSFGVDLSTAERMNETDEFTQTFISFVPVLGENMLMGTFVAERAKFIESLDDSVIVDVILLKLQSAFNLSLPLKKHLLKFSITRWGQDEFSCGSYAYIGLQSTEEHLDQLAACVDDKLFFAGDYTCKDFISCTHGAHVSGIRVANQILSLKKLAK